MPQQQLVAEHRVHTGDIYLIETTRGLLRGRVVWYSTGHCRVQPIGYRSEAIEVPTAQLARQERLAPLPTDDTWPARGETYIWAKAPGNPRDVVICEKPGGINVRVRYADGPKYKTFLARIIDLYKRQ
jgi:hypothetical protein